MIRLIVIALFLAPSLAMAQTLGGYSLSGTSGGYALNTSMLKGGSIETYKYSSDYKPRRIYSRKLRRAKPSPEVAEALYDVASLFANRPEVSAAGLSPETFRQLFTAMIQQESGFNPRAVSPKGAMGLGQIMPLTAKSLNLSEPYQVKPNLIAAATYLTRQLRSFGTPELALAAYNAGPGAVRRAKGVPNYPETQAYVAAIMGAVQIETH